MHVQPVGDTKRAALDTKRHSLMELSQALATGEGPASLYELLRRAH